MLSHGNADDFASTFVWYARAGDLEEYVTSLTFLLQEDRWRALGAKGYGYVLNTHEYEDGLGQHIAATTALWERGIADRGRQSVV